MKDLNGNELGKGIVRVRIWYYKVFAINNQQLIVSEGFKNIQGAREETEFEDIWDDVEGIEQIEYKSLGVFDSKGREYKVGDIAELWEGKNVKVLKSIKSINNDKIDFICYKDDDCDGGWNFGAAIKCTILHSALEKPVEEKPESALSLLQDFLSGLEKSLEIVNKKIREGK